MRGTILLLATTATVFALGLSTASAQVHSSDPGVVEQSAIGSSSSILHPMTTPPAVSPGHTHSPANPPPSVDTNADGTQTYHQDNSNDGPSQSYATDGNESADEGPDHSAENQSHDATQPPPPQYAY